MRKYGIDPKRLGFESFFVSKIRKFQIGFDFEENEMLG